MSERIEDEDIAKWLKWARANGPTDRTMIPEIIEQLRAERDAAVRANDLGAERMAELIVERDEARAQLKAIRAVVDEQALDEGLWA